MSRALLLVALTTTACAAEDRSRVDERPATWAEASPPPTEPPPAPRGGKRSADEVAAGFHNATVCEAAARRLYTEDAAQGWALLVACVRKGDFILLKPLLEPPWDAEIQKRKTGAPLLTSVIAARGGDIAGDLALLHQKRFPIFSLTAALAEPDAYMGRLIVVRGRASERRTEAGRLALLVEETAVEGSVVDKELGPRSTVRSQGEASGTYSSRGTSSTYGSSSYDASASARWRSKTSYVTEEDGNRNLVVGTGRRLVLRTEKSDPFLQTDTDYVFLLRFEGVRQVANDEDEVEDAPPEEAIGTVLSYLPPSARLSY